MHAVPNAKNSFEKTLNCAQNWLRKEKKDNFNNVLYSLSS